MYIAEAHAEDEWQLGSNEEEGVIISQHTSFEERRAAAERCVAELGLTMPALVDEMDDVVNKTFAAWPERIYILIDGRIYYKGGPGPFEFDVPEASERLATHFVTHLTEAEIEAGMAHINQSPKDGGEILMMMKRPSVEKRQLVSEAELDVEAGMTGDNWATRGSSRTKDGTSHPEMQLTLMGSRFLDLIAQEKSRWILAGDQLIVDMDLSEENLPVGTQLQVGTAVVEITAEPHTGCKKFNARFGLDALKAVSTKAGRATRLRGVNAKIVQSGTVALGDTVTKK